MVAGKAVTSVSIVWINSGRETRHWEHVKQPKSCLPTGWNTLSDSEKSLPVRIPGIHRVRALNRDNGEQNQGTGQTACQVISLWVLQHLRSTAPEDLRATGKDERQLAGVSSSCVHFGSSGLAAFPAELSCQPDAIF